MTFTAGWLAGGLSQPKGYSFVRDDISDLGALTADRAWIYNRIGANLTGLLVILLALGLWRAIGEGRAARIGLTALAVAGAGIFSDGWFRLDCRRIDDCLGNGVSWREVAHMIESLITLFCIVLAPFLLARGVTRLALWRDQRLPMLAVGVVTIATLVGFSLVGAGLGERVGSTIWFIWLALLARRLLQLAADPAAAEG